MKIAIVSAIKNGIGLQREYELLRDYLDLELGHQVVGIDHEETKDWISMDGSYDLTIFLEVVPRNLLGLSERRWAFLNPEWTKPEMVEIVERSFEKVFAKTHEAERIFEPLFPGRVHYTGFLCRDQYNPNYPRIYTFLHLAGNSLLRGTEAVLDAWRWKKDGEQLAAKLWVVGTAKFSREGFENDDRVMFLDRLDEDELKRTQNMCRYHLLPSGTEGFGHAMHEALSVNAVLITTNAPPMNEIKNAIFVPAERTGKYNLADIYSVNALDIYNAVQVVTEGDISMRASGEWDRQEFLKGNEFFKTEMQKHLGSTVKHIERVRRTDGKKTITFLGNFEAHESTENMVKWALTERLNIHVETLQENKVNLAAIREAMEWNDLFLWVRTPGWLQVHDTEMIGFLAELATKKIPSVSLHLDKFWGIPSREEKIGVDPFWRTQHVWTADGSRDEDFQKRGVNHHWMRPAVSEEYCHPGRPYDHLRCDVAFVGAKDYHGEYPFRRQLVEFLEQTYGERFKHVTNVRGHELNNVYASAKVVVGDCIFAGTPYYWSDRVPETCGRHGFLIHPAVKGLVVPLPTYEPQNLESLKEQIDDWLGEELQRRYITKNCAAYVLKYDTWTVRMDEILTGLL